MKGILIFIIVIIAFVFFSGLTATKQQRLDAQEVKKYRERARCTNEILPFVFRTTAVL